MSHGPMIQDLFYLLIKLLHDQRRGPFYLHPLCIHILMVRLQKTNMESWVKLEPLKQLQHVGHLPNPFYHLEWFIILRN